MKMNGKFILRNMIWFAAFAPAVASADYTLLYSMQTTPGPKLECSLSVLINYAKAEVLIIRLETKDEKHNMAAFLGNPDDFSNYGKRYSITELFPRGDMDEFKTIDARIDFSRGQELRLTASYNQGPKLFTRRSITGFLSPAVGKCLQPIQ